MSRTKDTLSTLKMSFRSVSPTLERLSCRICLEPGEECEFFRPCKCRGSAIGIHPACLQTWILHAPTARAKTHCTVCDTEYRLGPPMKHCLSKFCRLIHHNSILTGSMLVSFSATAAIPIPYHPYIFGAGIFCSLTFLFLIHILFIYFTYPIPRRPIAYRVVRGSSATSIPIFTFGGCWIILYDEFPYVRLCVALVCLGMYFHCVTMWLHFVTDGFIKKIDRKVLPYITDPAGIIDIPEENGAGCRKENQIISLAINNEIHVP